MKDLAINLAPMDWGLLRRQKRDLVKLQSSSFISAREFETLEGVLALLDRIQDEAVDTLRLPEKEVFKAKMPRRR